MATVDVGALRFNWKGAYSGGTAYVVDDVVSSGGSSYVCIQAHGAGTQAVSVAAYWSIMAQVGTNGTNGTNGTDLGTVITTEGDIAFRDGSGLQRLAKGTASQSFKMNAAATAPEWVKTGSLDATPSPDHTINGPQTNTVLAGYTTAIGDLVYLDPNGRWEEADADATSTSISLLGIAMEVQSDGVAVNVALSGSFIVDASWSFGVGVPLYVSNTLGDITATKPTGSGDVVRTVGYALTATTIFFAPSSDYVTLA